MFMPPVKATSRSTTMILRWSRKGWVRRLGSNGLKRLTSMPRPAISYQNAERALLEPTASTTTRTRTPRSTAAASASRIERPVASSLKM